MIPALLVPSVRPRGLLLGIPLGGFVGGTQQLTLKQYLIGGGFTLSNSGVTWSSSNTAIARVDATGLVTFFGIGSAVVTATVAGQSYSTTASVATPLALTFDWAPVAHPEELAQPLVFQSSEAARPSWGGTAGDGYTNYTPDHIGGAYGNNVRITYPRRGDVWEQCVPNQNTLSSGASFQPWGVTSVLQPTGPYDNTRWFRCTFGASGLLRWFSPGSPDSSVDGQDLATHIESTGLLVKGVTSADVGRQFDILLIDSWVPVSYNIVKQGPRITIQSATDSQVVSIDFDSVAQKGAVSIIFIAADGGGAVIDVGFLDLPSARVSPYLTSKHELRWNFPFHEQLGILCQQGYRNGWAGGDDPIVGGGATKSSSAVLAPDSHQYAGGRTMPLVTLPPGGYIITNGNVQIDETHDDIPSGNSNVPVRWVHGSVWLKPAPGHTMPADGDLKGYVTGVNTGAYAAVALERDTLAPLRGADGASFYRFHTQVNLTRDANNVPQSPSDVQFTVKIQNDSAATIQAYCYRASAVGDFERTTGSDQCAVPKLALSGPSRSNAAVPNITATAPYITRNEGFMIWRFVLRQSWGDVGRLKMGGNPGFWNSGVYGTADFMTEMSLEYVGDTDQSRLLVQVTRGVPVASSDYRGWQVMVPNLPKLKTFIPGGVALDVAVAWKDDACVALGLGIDPGTDLEWITNGQSWRGSDPAQFASRHTQTPWEFTDPDQPTGGSHMIAGDFDKTRFTGGWVQATAFGNTVNSATFQNSAEVQILKRLGPRLDYREA